ncbi:hypothetical protein WCLP8_850002 [uncultured Gammaproteobacteria bacterium]
MIREENERECQMCFPFTYIFFRIYRGPVFDCNSRSVFDQNQACAVIRVCHGLRDESMMRHKNGLITSGVGGRAEAREFNEIMIEWSCDLMVNNHEIDSDHKHLVEMINGLYRAIGRGEGKQVIGDTLGNLADYVAGHFYREERLMEVSRFPDLVDHIVDHWCFTERLTGLVHAFEIGKEGVALETLEFLSSWFVNHIQEKDMKIGHHLATLPPRQ